MRAIGVAAPRYDSSGLLCAIDGYPVTGCGESDGTGAYVYWSYWTGSGDTWTYATAGPAGRKLADGAVEAVTDWLGVRGAIPGALFVSFRKRDRLTSEGITDQAVYYILAERAQQAHVKAFSPHDLRRTFAKRSRHGGAALDPWKALPGHARVRTTA